MPQRVQAAKDFGLVAFAGQRFHRVTDLHASAREQSLAASLSERGQRARLSGFGVGEQRLK